MPRDGKKFGRLKVRGPSVARAYFKEEGSILDDNGYFDTGDVATLDPYGYMQITDRSKDVIKSGGEWISSIDIENFAVGHPKVAEAAVIGVRHPKWDERPLLIVVLKPGQTATKAELLAFLDGKIAKWWMPDDVAFVRRNPAHRDRQDSQDRAAGPIQKLRAADGRCRTGIVRRRRIADPASQLKQRPTAPFRFRTARRAKSRSRIAPLLAAGISDLFSFENNDLRLCPRWAAGTRYRIKIRQNCCVAQ